MADSLTKKVNENTLVSRRHYEIHARDPWELPDQTVEIPSPSRMPLAPTTPNLLSMMLGPILMIVMYGVMFAYQAMQAEEGSSAGISPVFFMMPLIGIGQPIATWFSFKNQSKKHIAAMQAREQGYRKTLSELRDKLDALSKQQREVLDREYPLLPRLVSTGLGTAHKKRLWWRRAADRDFLALRMGTGSGKASFTLSSPRFVDPEDPLASLASDVLQAYQEVSQIPLLLEMLKIGSVALADQGSDAVYGLARRLTLDLIVNHSPQDVQVVVLADTKQARDRWDWLKWAPHTRALNQGDTNRRLAFDADSVEKSMKWLMDEFGSRGKPEPGARRKLNNQFSIVVLLDDSGDIRRTEDIRQLSAYGMDVNIYLIFVGGRHWPRECRARIEASKDGFKYIETFAGEEKGRRLRGETDLASLIDCERVARAQAGLEVSSTGGRGNLPESVRLSEILIPRNLSLEGIRNNWEKARSSDELLQFPFGLRNGRKGLTPATLNLLPPPPEFSGIGAYHTILVGTTGSGKSELMKSLVLSAAHKYSPRLLNFFFMDFKGGAAFNDFKELPHVVGVVTNLGPQLVERGLSALDAEIKRRQNWFADGGVENIWAYNAKYPKNQMPHLMLLLDEFSRGMTEFPRLPDMLEMLGRIGRSLGIYLLLGNQNVNSAMDRLLNNVGWRIVMKVNSPEEARPLIKRLPGEKIERIGQGFLHSSQEKEDAVYEFQGAYAGFSVIEPEENVEETFKIFQVENNGRWNPNPLYTNMRRISTTEKDRNRPKEQGQLITQMKELSQEYEPARPIYLEPLEADISLETILEDAESQRAFVQGNWVQKQGNLNLKVPIGYTDSTEDCMQNCLHVDFSDQDGHLWLIGGPSSGKVMTIETTLLTLALTNTPEEAWFYILEFGATGKLRHFQSLPHCGAVITQKDLAEMLDRLLKFLEEEMNQRMHRSNKNKKTEKRDAEIFLVINNFFEFKNAYPDQVDRIAPFINGKAMGIHLIIATNRRIELPNKLSIARKVVLRLANRDEYSDAIGGRVTILPTLQAEGRGLWVDGKVLECQIARPAVVLDGENQIQDAETASQLIGETWPGTGAPKIRMLPTQIPLADLLKQTSQQNQEDLLFPVGVSFENLQPITVNLMKEIPRWLVLGPPRSGKSNFLACLANTVLSSARGTWEVMYFSLRRSMPDSIDKSSVKLAGSASQAVQIINELLASLEHNLGTEKKYLLLFDDMGAAFEPGREALVVALNNLGLNASSHENIVIIGAGSPDELRPYQMTSQLLRILKQSRMGIAFSKEAGDMEFLTAPALNMQQRRLELMPGRGFWVNGGKSFFVQSPLAVKQDVLKSEES